MSNALVEKDTVVLSVLCEEPEGDIVRHVRPMELSIENMKKFWDLAKDYKTLFTEEIRGDFGKFVNQMMKQTDSGSLEATGLYWVVDDFVGVFYMTDITMQGDQLLDALVHYTFLDGRHRGRLNLVKELLKFAFTKYGYIRLTTRVALYATRHTFIFVEKIGFKKEGRIRRAVLKEGEYFDVNSYGILKEEVLDG